ncbi:MAG: serine hydrolase domain-containing protein [Psychroserpens sp.]|uniref:serine hydrolase domain-containing protein n=1 Tax=Psychroserpens sp. TaxID=2020870 RepID=UPI0030023B39
MRNPIKFIILIFTFIGCKSSVDINPVKKIDSIKVSMDKNAESFLIASNINSVSIGIYKNGEIHTGHFGELDKGMGNTPNDATIYEIGSNTKTFTGFLVAQAVLEGKLTIEDDVQKFLDEEYLNFVYKQSPIKIKHLLTHTSGLVNTLPPEVNALFGKFEEEGTPEKINRVYANYSKEKFLEDLHGVQIDTIPGYRFSYSNAGVELLGHILEVVYEDNFDNLLKTFIFERAEMTNTKMELMQVDLLNVANGLGFSENVRPLFYNPLWGSAGKLKSTTPDLTKYLRLQLDSTSTTIRKSREVIYSEDGRTISYLWRVRAYEEFGNYYYHHGGSFRTQNMIFVFPQFDLGISVITNRSDNETGPQLQKLAFSLLEDLK